MCSWKPPTWAVSSIPRRRRPGGGERGGAFLTDHAVIHPRVHELQLPAGHVLAHEGTMKIESNRIIGAMPGAMPHEGRSSQVQGLEVDQYPRSNRRRIGRDDEGPAPVKVHAPCRLRARRPSVPGPLCAIFQFAAAQDALRFLSLSAVLTPADEAKTKQDHTPGDHREDQYQQ